MKADAKLKDPVCGMTVSPDSIHKFTYQRHDYYFCSSKCREKFASDPDGYLSGTAANRAEHGTHGTHESDSSASGAEYICPMDPEVSQDRPGSCPKCGTKMFRIGAMK